MSTPIMISSRDNPGFRHLRSLVEDARYRRAQGRTVIDGAHLLCAALDAALPLIRVVWAESADSHEIEDLRHRCAALGVPASQFAAPLFRALSPVDTPTGVLAEIAIPASVLALPDDADVLVLDGVQDAGNLGSLLRSAAAAGIRHAWLGEGCAQAWSPKVLRAGMGAHFLLHIEERVALDARVAEFDGLRIATLLSAGSRSLYQCDLRARSLWLFGAEGRGLSAELAALANLPVTIPMPGGAESLNVAAAAAVCLFEQLRQRQM